MQGAGEVVVGVPEAAAEATEVGFQVHQDRGRLALGRVLLLEHAPRRDRGHRRVRQQNQRHVPRRNQ